eukprot:1110232-Prymnesium_polylepis.2
MVTSGVSRWRALRAWLGSRRLRSRRACVSVVVPRAASGVGLADCASPAGPARPRLDCRLKSSQSQTVTSAVVRCHETFSMLFVLIQETEDEVKVNAGNALSRLWTLHSSGQKTAPLRGGSSVGRSVGRPRSTCRSGSGSEAGRSVGPRRPKHFSALRAAEGRSVGPITRVGIGLGRRVGSVGRMLKMLLRTTITPQTTAGPGTSIRVTVWPAASVCNPITRICHTQSASLQRAKVHRRLALLLVGRWETAAALCIHREAHVLLDVVRKRRLRGSDQVDEVTEDADAGSTFCFLFERVSRPASRAFSFFNSLGVV